MATSDIDSDNLTLDVSDDSIDIVSNDISEDMESSMVDVDDSNDENVLIDDSKVIEDVDEIDVNSQDKNNNDIIKDYDIIDYQDKSNNVIIKDYDIIDNQDKSNNVIIKDYDIIDNQDKSNKDTKKLLSIVYDSGLVNSNDVIYFVKPIGSKNVLSSSSVLSSPQTIIIEDASHYGDSLNAIIQGIIDKATAGSTIQFTGSSYENLALRISKPLNIISKSGTVITTIFNVPVFTITMGGSGTNISGFTTNLVGSFVDASDVSNIRISNNKISTKRTGIVLNEVYDSVIRDNVFSRFDTAIDISHSGGISISKNNITPDNSYNTGIKIKSIESKKPISILNNNIIGFDSKKTCTGLYFGKDAANVYLKGNFIRKWATAIEMPYSVNNVTMYNNTITNNGDGIIINGWIYNFTFKKNLVNNNARVGILFDDNFKGTKGNLDLENNYFSYNGVLDLQDKGDQAVAIGKNFAARKCYRVGMKYTFKIRSRQSGGKYYFSVVDKYGNAISDLPTFSAQLTVNGKQYTVTFIDGKAYVNSGSGGNGKGGSGGFLDIGEDNRNLNSWGQYEQIDAEEMSYYEEIFNQLAGIITEDADADDFDDDFDADDYNNESGSSSSHSGSGSGDSGLSQGSNSVSMNGDLSGSSGTAGASAAASPASSPSASASSNPSSVEDAASMKTLSVDDETFRVIGVGGLVLLIIFVIGLYYREDIMEMVKEE